MNLCFSEGSSVPVGPLFIFGEFAVQEFHAQKGEGTELFIWIEGFEDLGDVHK